MKKLAFLVLFGVLIGIAHIAYAHTDTTVIGRSKVTDPDFGYEGGAGLATVIRNGHTGLSDDLNSRYEEWAAQADSTTVVHDHNFGVAFDELRIQLYTGSGTNLVRITDPTGSGWTIEANSGDPKLKVDVTTPGSGGPHTFAIVVINATFIPNILTTRGDLVVRDSANETARLATGATNTFLISDGNDPSWSATPPGTIPIGGMITVMPNISGSWQPPTTGVVKDGFMIADGATVSDAGSPLNGQILPNMTGGVYVRGDTTSGGTGGANTQATNVIVATQPEFSNHAAISAHTGGSVTPTSGLIATIEISHGHGFTQPSNHSDINIAHGHGHTNPTVVAESSHTHGAGSYAASLDWFSNTLQWRSVPSPSFTSNADVVVGGLTAGGYTTTSGIDVLGTSSSGSSHTHSLSGGGVVSLGSTLKSISSHSGGAVINLGTTNRNDNIDHGHGFTQPSNHNAISAHSRSADVSLTNNTINNEPSYIKVIWVIRVK